MNVVAKGIENKEQLNLLNDLRCDRAQGYLFTRPMPAELLLTQFTLGDFEEI